MALSRCASILALTAVLSSVPTLHKEPHFVFGCVFLGLASFLWAYVGPLAAVLGDGSLKPSLNPIRSLESAAFWLSLIPFCSGSFLVVVSLFDNHELQRMILVIVIVLVIVWLSFSQWYRYTPKNQSFLHAFLESGLYLVLFGSVFGLIAVV
jgi:hypothetical protein